MNKKTFFTSVLLSAALYCNTQADDFIFQDIQQKLDKKKINDVELTKVLETPSLYKNSTIRFEAKFTQTGKLSRVFHTKYDLSEYVNFSVWPDEVRLWEKEGLKKFSPLLFVNKSSDNATTVGKLKKYQRVLITGMVTNDYQNQPWIEVLEIKVLDKDPLSEEALYHIRLGDKYHFGDNPESVKEKSVESVEEAKDKKAVMNMGIDLVHAELEYKKSLTFDLGDVEKSAVYELLGEVQLKQGKTNEAIASLSETLKIDEDSGNANHLMAKALLQSGKPVDARKYGEKAGDILSKDKEVLLTNSAILFELKQYDLARASAINALRLDSEDIRPYAQLGKIYDATNEYDVAKEMYRRAINLKEGVDNFDLHKNMAHQLLKIALVEKNPKEKESALSQADRAFSAAITQINDKDPEAYYLWGRVLEEWKNRPKSETDSLEKFEKAIALSPDYFNAHMHKASVLNYRLNKPKDAIASYEKAATIRPNDVSPLKALDKIYRDAKNYEKTVSVNTRIVAIEPKNFSALNALGVDYAYNLNQQPAAVEWFTKALAVDPNNSEVEFNLGRSLYLSGKKTESLRSLQNASVKLPNNKNVWLYLAKAYSDTDQSTKAIEALLKYNALDAESPEVHALLSAEYVKNPKTVESAVTTGSNAVKLAEKQKAFLGQSYDAHGWALANHGKSQEALAVLEKANKEQGGAIAQYHLAYVYVQLNMYPEADAQLKKLEATEQDKKLAADIKKLRSELNGRTKEKSDGKVETPVEKKSDDKSADAKKKEEADKKAAMKKAEEDAKEAEKMQKLEEQKRLAREKEKKEQQDKIAKEEAEKAKQNELAQKEEQEKLKKKKANDEAKAAEDKKAEEKKMKEAAEKKADEDKAKAKAEEEQKKKDKKLAEQKAEEDAKAKKLADKKKKEDEEKAAETAKEQERKQKDADKLKAQQDKEARAAAEKKAKEDAAKAESDKKAKDKADKEAKAKAEADAKAKAEAEKKSKELAEQKAKEDAAKAESDKKAKEKADKEAKVKADADAKAKAEAEKKSKELAEQKAKEDAAKAESDKKAKEKADKEAKAKADAEAKAKAETEKKNKELAEKKAKEDAEKAAAAKKAQEQQAKEAAKAKAEQEKLAKAKAEEENKKNKELAEIKAKEDAEKAKAALAKEKEEKAKKAAADKKAQEDAKKAEEERKKNELAEKAKREQLEKQKADEMKAAEKEAEEKRKNAEKIRKERLKAEEQAAEIEKQRKKEAEKESK